METRAFASLDETVFTQLGHAWIRDGFITEDQLVHVLSRTSDQSEQFQSLLQQGIITEAQLLHDLSSVMACPFWNPSQLHEKASGSLSLIGRFPQNILQQWAMLPVGMQGPNLLVAISSWPSQQMFGELQRQVQCQSVTFGFAPRAAILSEINAAFHNPSTIRASVQNVEDSWDDWEPITPPSQAKANPSEEDELMSLAGFDVPTTSSPSLSQASQPSLNKPPAGLGSQASLGEPSQENVDSLLADFLTPDTPFPAVNPSPSQTQAQAPSHSSLEQAQAPGRLNIRSSQSLPSANAPESPSQPRGLDALRQDDSSSILGLDGPRMTDSMSMSALPNPNAPSRNMLIAADIKDVKKARSKNKKGKKNTKRDERQAIAMSWFLTIVRILAIAGVGYLIYLGYQNGI